MAVAEMGGVERLVAFHHDPGHTDDFMDGLYAEVDENRRGPVHVSPAREGTSFAVGAPA